MRHLFAVLIASAGLSALSGCALSVYPLHSKETVVNNGALRGEWIVPTNRSDQQEVYDFDWGGRADNSYHITYFKSHRGKEVQVAYWDAYLVKLGDDYYLDAKPVSFELTEQPSQEGYVMGLHAIFRCEFKEGKEIRLVHLNLGEIHKTIVEKKIDHVMNEGQPILTLKTKDLQAFFIKYGDALVQKGIKKPALLLKPKPKPDRPGKKKAAPKEPPVPEKKLSA